MLTEKFLAKSPEWELVTERINKGDEISIPFKNILGVVLHHNSARNKFVLENDESSIVYAIIDYPVFKKVKITTEDYKWSAPITISKNLDRDRINAQIINRYHIKDYIPSNSTVVDSMMPSLMLGHTYRHLKQVKGCSISPWFADITNSTLIEPSELVRILGYTEIALTKLMKKVKGNNNNLIMLGYGGTGVNTLYWLQKISELTEVYEVFDSITIFEPEDLEISNLLRFPKNPSNTYSGDTSKLSLLEKEQILAYNDIQSFSQYFDYRRMEEMEHLENLIYYGAPDIKTRDMLTDKGNFIAATHGDSECSLHLNPAQDTQLQVESYGKIELNVFFMNQIRMAIGLLEILADDSIDLKEIDKELLSFSFNGEHKRKTKHTYNFNINKGQ